MNANTLSEVSVRCSFNTNITSLSLTDFANYCQVDVEAAKEVLAALYDAKLVTSSAKSWKSPYFIRNAAVYLSNQAYLADAAVLEADLVEAAELAANAAEAAEDAALEADEVAAAEHEADLLEGDLDLLMAELEAAGLADPEPEVLLVPAPAAEVPTDIATTKLEVDELVYELQGRKATDRKAFRRAVRNHLAGHDLPWTIEAGTYWLQDPNYIYTISFTGTDIRVTVSSPA